MANNLGIRNRRLPALLLTLLLVFSFSAYFSPATAQPVTKESLVNIGPVWIKVTVTLPTELVATDEYQVPVTILITEVEGAGLKVFYLKGLRITIGDTSTLEVVPDTPYSLSPGRPVSLTVKLTPRFFASQMVPGDRKDTTIKIDLSYYFEMNDGSSSMGFYSAFTSIPVRVIAPRTYVYVEPYLKTDYDPFYIVRFYVDIWVKGEGFIENAQAEISGAPVQCYLLTTGKMNVEEKRTLEFLMNVSKLGPFARSQYSVTVKVTAVTPWGYTYSYSFPLNLVIKPVRETKVNLPSTVVANTYVPVSFTLNPPLDKDEQATVSIMFENQPVYSGDFAPTVYASFPQGEGTVTVKIDSNKYSPSIVKLQVKSTTVQPRANLQVTANTLVIRVSPLYTSSNVEVRVTDQSGATVLATTLPDTAFTKTPVTIEGAATSEGVATLPLSLNPGNYKITVTYNTPAGQATASTSYTVQGAGGGTASPTPSLPILPILIIVVVVVIAVVLIVIIRRRRAETE